MHPNESKEIAMPGKFIFVSGLSGAGKSTLVRAVLAAVDNCETVVTYVTRPMRAGDEDAYEYVFVSDDEYETLKAKSDNWDETIYDEYKYGADGAKYAKDLQDGINIIVSVAPDIRIIQAMSQKYSVQPVTVWIDTDEQTAKDRIKDDSQRSARLETANIKDQFDIIFEPSGDSTSDTVSFGKIVSNIISGNY